MAHIDDDPTARARVPPISWKNCETGGIIFGMEKKANYTYSSEPSRDGHIPSVDAGLYCNHGCL